MNFIDRSRPRSNPDTTMANLRQFVITQYQAAPRQVKNMAQQFFNAMDRDGNKSVDYSEFKFFLVSEGLEYYAGRNLFMMLDGDGNRGLDFWEVMTLYYIIKSGRPFCFSCDIFLSGVYQVCNMCRGGPSYICNNCQQGHLAEHLQPKIRQTIRPSMNRPRAPNAGAMYPSRGHPARFSSSNSMVPVTRSAAHFSSSNSMVPMNRNNASFSSSNSMVPMNRNNASFQVRDDYSSLRTAYKAFEMAMDMADLASTLASCSIM
ncbi:uncharacterized protein LOC108202421 isoform X4 [Daucus carota subsp. sativus]|uniref:uncharacterized protein LOC108202421 isoform X4 n=1 Tax=Daucus carota subsp. sativus TaxID=79200 RepID=UPI003082D85A